MSNLRIGKHVEPVGCEAGAKPCFELRLAGSSLAIHRALSARVAGAFGEDGDELFVFKTTVDDRLQ